MADRKISDLTALTTPATGDLIPIVDVSEAAAADKNKSITVQELFKGVPDGTAAAPGLAFESDDGNGIFLAGTDQVGVATGGVERVEFGASEVVFNDGGADYDFRIEGDTNTSLFFVDASTDRVGVGTTSPGHTLEVNGQLQAKGQFYLTDGSSNDILRITEIAARDVRLDAYNGTDFNGTIRFGAQTLVAETGTGGSITERLRIDSSGRVGIGTSSPAFALTVNSGAAGTPVSGFGQAGDNPYMHLERWDGVNNFDAVRLSALNGGAAGGILTISNGTGTTRGSQTFTERVRIDSSGRVGIGSTAPARQFTVYNSSTPIIQLVNSTTGQTANDGVMLYESGSNFVIENQEAGEIQIYNNGSQRATITSSGQLLVGTSTARSNFYNTTVTSAVQVEGTTGDTSSLAVIANRSGSPSRLILASSGGSTVGSNTVVSSGNGAGSISFQASDGTQFVQTAEINAEIDGTPGADDMPGRLVFSTTADGASSPTERMRINNAGRLTVQYGGAVLRSHTRADNAHQITHNEASTDVLWLNVTTTSYAAAAHRINVYRTNTSDFSFAQFTSGNLGDDEFIFRGDGNGFADGSFSGGGADYAEYFEWSDGNTTAEDRRGISVVLDGDKIREAVAGEEPIGVISGNPSVVGDAAWNKWNGKYLRDDFGTYIRNAEGERQLNPDYDPDVEYVSRENRPEWDCVGLMGKLRIRKGQVTGTRWIKMRDVSDTVEEWLVR